MNKNFPVKYKKGAVSSAISDFWAYVLFVFVIIIFYAFFTYQASGEKNKIESTHTKISNDLELLNYLRTPVTVENKEIDVAELLRLWSLEPDKYEDIFKKYSTDILNNFEYEYFDEPTKSVVVRGFQLLIFKSKNNSVLENNLYELKSQSFDVQFCINYQPNPEQVLPDCINLAEQFIPITESSGLYIVLRESSKPK